MHVTSSNPASTASRARTIRRRARAAWLLAAALTLAACASTNPYYDPAKAHHRPNGFVNADPTAMPPPLSALTQLWRMLSGYYRPLQPPAGGYEVFAAAWTATPELDFLKANRRQTTLTWLGHAAMLLQVDGVNVLIDPALSERASPLSWSGPPRRVPAPIPVADLPDIDVVLISHNHYDHLDARSIEQLRVRFPKARYLVPLGLKAWFSDAGIDHVRELDWWETETLGAVCITLTPAQHWSKRTPFDRNQSLWGGFIVEATRPPAWRFLYTGDTGYSQDFRAIRERVGPVDLLALPVGAYAPRDFMKNQHVNPAEAVQIALDVEAKRTLGVHWGTFELTQESFDAPPRELAAARAAAGLPESRVFVVKHGATLRELRDAP